MNSWEKIKILKKKNTINYYNDLHLNTSCAGGGGGAKGACASPFSKKKKKKYFLFFVFTPTILSANMFIYHFI